MAIGPNERQSAQKAEPAKTVFKPSGLNTQVGGSNKLRRVRTHTSFPLFCVSTCPAERYDNDNHYLVIIIIAIVLHTLQRVRLTCLMYHVVHYIRY